MYIFTGVTKIGKMKKTVKILSLAVLCGCMPCTVKAQEAGAFDVTVPAPGSRNTDCIMINRVAGDRSSVTLYMSAYNRPHYWVRLLPDVHLRGCVTGRKYKLLRSEGFELGKEVYMPDEGYVDFRLVFEPLDEADTRFDFIEGEEDGKDWQLLGIELNPVRSGKIHTRLEGTVEGGPEGQLLMLHPKELGNVRNSYAYALVPVRNGKFTYDLYTDGPKAWAVCLWNEYFIKGSWHSVTFFNEEGTVKFGFSEDRAGVEESDTKENNRMIGLKAKIEELFDPEWHTLAQLSDSLHKADALFSVQYKDVLTRLEALPEDATETRHRMYVEMDSLRECGACYSKEGKALEKKWEDMWFRRNRYEMEQLSKERSLYGLVRIWDELKNQKENSERWNLFKEFYRKDYAGFCPGNFYHGLINMQIAAGELRPGMPYMDYVVEEKNGMQTKVSELIKGKVAWIDLWASWCGPCRTHSKQMIPVYEHYKDKDFVVVAIAREQNEEDMEKAREKDGYPWKSYVDVKDKLGIWNKHGIPNAAGKTLLIDRDGTILSVDGSFDSELRILKEKLGD